MSENIIRVPIDGEYDDATPFVNVNEHISSTVCGENDNPTYMNGDVVDYIDENQYDDDGDDEYVGQGYINYESDYDDENINDGNYDDNRQNKTPNAKYSIVTYNDMLRRYKLPSCLDYALPNRQCLTDYAYHIGQVTHTNTGMRISYADQRHDPETLEIPQKYASDTCYIGGSTSLPNVDESTDVSIVYGSEDDASSNELSSSALRMFEPMFSNYTYHDNSPRERARSVQSIMDGSINGYEDNDDKDDKSDGTNNKMYRLHTCVFQDIISDISSIISDYYNSDKLDNRSVEFMSFMRDRYEYNIVCVFDDMRQKILGYMREALRRVLSNNNSALWTVENTTVTTYDFYGEPKTYDNRKYESPLAAFTASAYGETIQINNTVPWKDMYDEVHENRRMHGLYGELYTNALVDMRYYETHETVHSHNKIVRIPREKESGFVCSSYTAMSSNAGIKRLLVHNVNVRLMTDYVLNLVHSMFDLISEELDNDRKVYGNDIVKFINNNLRAKDGVRVLVNVVSFLGIHCVVTSKCIRRLVKLRNSFKGYNVPTLHSIVITSGNVTTYIWNISICSGVLMRPVRVCTYADDVKTTDSNKKPSMYEQPWYDSHEFGRLSNKPNSKIPKPEEEPLEFLSTSLHMIPYVLYDQNPRPMLSANMCKQAIAMPCVSVHSTIYPTAVTKPRILTPLSKQIYDQCSNLVYNIPGSSVMCGFINNKLNMEDAVIVSVSVASRIFSTVGIIKHPVADEIDLPEVGTILSQTTHKWWRYANEGEVFEATRTKKGGKYVVARTRMVDASLGDKLATWHGQKFVISDIRGNEDMPYILDDNGNKITLDVLISCSSVIRRNTIGQILEAMMAHNVEDPADYSIGNVDFEPYVTKIDGSDVDIEKLVKNKVGKVYRPDGTPYYVASVTELDKKEVCTCNYGQIWMWQLGHLARDKGHYSNEITRSARNRSGRSKGAPVKLSELEQLSMEAGGAREIPNELLNSSDTVITKFCSYCRHQLCLCVCSIDDRIERSNMDNYSKHIHWVEMAVRRPLLNFDILFTISNQFNGSTTLTGGGTPTLSPSNLSNMSSTTTASEASDEHNNGSVDSKPRDYPMSLQYK